MAGKSNAIGTGALVLTTNADKMLSGLDSAGKAAERKASQIGDKVGKASGGGRGSGLVGAILGGVAGGVTAVLGMGLFKALAQGPELALKVFDALDKRATGFDKGALTGIKNTFRGLQDAGLGILQKFVTAAAPAIMLLGNTLLGMFERLEPLIQGVADVFGTFAFVGVAVLEELISLLLDGLDELGLKTDDWGETTLNVLRVASKGFAYLWDTIKAGAGVIAVVAGLIVEGIGMILTTIGDAIKKVDELAQKLPDAIRPDWVGKAGETVGGWGKAAEDAGERMRSWGIKAVKSFGDSAGQVDAWFNKIDGRIKDSRNKIKNVAVEFDGKLAGAFDRGSKEAYSIAARYATGNMLSDATEKKHLREAEKQTIILQQIRDRGGLPFFGVL